MNTPPPGRRRAASTVTSAPPGRRRAALAATAAWMLLLAASASAHAPTASFEYTPQQPAPGELVEFASTSTPVPEHTEPLVLDWDLDGDGEFDDARGATARRAYEQGVHVVRLRRATSAPPAATRTSPSAA